MKLRVKGNSIRLRLAKSEVALLMRGAAVDERTNFPGGGQFIYQLMAGAPGARTSASFAGGTLTIAASPAELSAWANSDAVSLSAELPAGAHPLSVLIEKDFPCLVPREDEDPGDRFERPPGEENKSGVC